MKTSVTLTMAAVFGVFQSANAQRTIPIRELGPIEATATDSTTRLVSIRALPGGKILVSDALKYQIKLFDSTLSNPKIVQQFTREQTSVWLIPYSGDSTLYLDPSSRTLVMFDGEGKQVRVMALPHQQDAQYFGSMSSYGTATTDRKGRVVYLGQTPPPTPDPTTKYRINYQPDSAPLIRIDFDTRSVDTLARLRVLNNRKISIAEDANGVPIVTVLLNPVVLGDQWSMLSDGTVGIVRTGDYHVDFIDSDNKKHSTPRLPYDWVRMTDQDKQKLLDSLQGLGGLKTLGQPTDTYVQTFSEGMKKGKQIVNWFPMDQIPEYDGALSMGVSTVTPDANGRLWVLPRVTKNISDGGLLYDVISKGGEVVERVRIPKGRRLLGFGSNNVVYLARVEKSGATYIERARLK